MTRKSPDTANRGTHADRKFFLHTNTRYRRKVRRRSNARFFRKCFSAAPLRVPSLFALQAHKAGTHAAFRSKRIGLLPISRTFFELSAGGGRLTCLCSIAEKAAAESAGRNVFEWYQRFFPADSAKRFAAVLRSFVASAASRACSVRKRARRRLWCVVQSVVVDAS